MEEPGRSMPKIPGASFGNPRVVVRFTKAPRLSDESDSGDQIDELEFPIWSRTRLGDLPLPAKSRNALRLLVHIPDRYRNEIYTVVVRQIWKGKAVGRVTWQLGPRRVT